MRPFVRMLHAALLLAAGLVGVRAFAQGTIADAGIATTQPGRTWRVIITGLPPQPPEPEIIPEATLVKMGLCGAAPRSGRHLNGCFHYDYQWHGSPAEHSVAVDFSLAISLSDAIKNGKLPKVLAHEHRHFFDFLNLANRLQLDLEATARANGNPDMDNRMAWFRFDVCRADENYHMSLKESLWGSAACAGLKPRTDRPVQY